MKFWIFWDKFGIYLLFILIFLVFGLISPLMFTSINIINLLVNSSIILITSLGMTFAITVGRFDLSVGSMMAFATVIVGLFAPKVNLAFLIILPILVAILVGFITGIIITKIRIQAFVATLATMVIIKGITYLVTNGTPIFFISHPEIKVISTTNLLSMPLPIWIAAAIFIVFYILYKFTTFGVFLRSIGSNEVSARISGIKVDLIIIIVFILTAVCAAISGIIAVSRTLEANAFYGSTMIVDSITVTVLGGTSMKGGKGKLFGTAIGSILISVIRNGLNLQNVSTFNQNLITGILLILILVLNGLREIKTENLKLSSKGN